MEKEEPARARPLIYAKIAAVMTKVTAISKSRKNTSQNFNYRGIDEIYNELHDILAEEGVFSCPEVLEYTREERQNKKNGGAIMYSILKIRFRFFCEDGSFIDAVTMGEAMDFGDKSANKAMSVAHKYAFLMLLCIPTIEEKDPDAQSHEVEEEKKPQPLDNETAIILKAEPLKKTPEAKKVSRAQVDLLYKTADWCGWHHDDVHKAIFNKWGIKTANDIPADEFNLLLEHIESYSRGAK